MAPFLPVSLLLVYIAFFGFLNTHQRHAARFEGASQGYLLALQSSVLLGSLTALALLVYYGSQTKWYWPLLLFSVGSLISGLLFAWFDRVIGLLGLSLVSFAGWPIAAFLMYRIVSALSV